MNFFLKKKYNYGSVSDGWWVTKKWELKAMKKKKYIDNGNGFAPFDGDEVILLMNLVMDIKFCGES